MPGDSRHFEVSEVPAETDRLRYYVEVIPDHFYKGVYEGLLSGSLEADAEKLIKEAVKQADANDYVLFEGSVKLN
jgi:hypothetical protein